MMDLDVSDSVGLYAAAWSAAQLRAGFSDKDALASLKKFEATFPDALEKSASSPMVMPLGQGPQMPSAPRMALKGGSNTSTRSLSGDMNTGIGKPPAKSVPKKLKFEGLGFSITQASAERGRTTSSQK
ncbi:MAG: hypothetical protein WCR74_05850 [Betaproteobacteria bacterium]